MSDDNQPAEGRWLALAGLFVIAAPASSVVAQRTSGWVFWLVIALQLVFTGAAFAIPQALQVRARRNTAKSEADDEARELETRAETRAALGDALEPVLVQLGEVSSEKDATNRDLLIAQTIPFVLGAAANLIGTDRSRACWFELSDGDPDELVPKNHIGRTGSPTTTFTRDTLAGNATIEMVLSGESVLCEDIDKDPPEGWDASKARDYKTFISVSVTAGDYAYGMLTLDAPEAGALTKADLNMLRLMAQALAAALAQGD
jgi:transcriptional regulator with GAF, ATPase, and Fis domain